MSGQTADGFKRYHAADTWIPGIRVFLFAFGPKCMDFLSVEEGVWRKRME